MTDQNGSEFAPPQLSEKEIKAMEKAPNISLDKGQLVPQDFTSLWWLCRVIAGSGMAPKDKQDPAKILVATQLGQQIGLPMMASIQNIAVINGMPSIWGDAMIGVVRASGELEVFLEYETGSYGKDDYTAWCIAKRRGFGNDADPEKDSPSDLQRKGWTVNSISWVEAKESGYLSKQGPWQTARRRMFKMRARAFTLRDLFPDFLKGIHMREEMDEPIDITPTTIQQANTELSVSKDERKEQARAAIQFNPPPTVTDPGPEPGQPETPAETEQPGPEDSGPPTEPPPATPPPAPEKPRRGRPAKPKTEGPKEPTTPTPAPATDNHAKQQANMLFEATIREWSARASKNVDQMLHFAAIWIEGVIQDSLMHYASYDDAYIKVRERAVDSWTAKAAPLFIDYLNKHTASSGGEIPQDEPPPADVTQTELQPGENEPEPGSYEPDEEQPNAIIGYQNCASYSEAVNYFKVHAGVFSLPENTAALKVAKEWFEAKYKRPFPALLIASAGQAQQQRAAAPPTPAPAASDESMVAQIAAIRKSDAQGLLKVAMKLQMSTSNLSQEGMNRLLDGYTEYRQDPVAFMKK